jgi:uncharacterized membrane protein
MEKGIKDGFMSQSKAASILPTAAQLESYEEVAPGSVKKIVDMAVSEQKHRQQWEEKYLIASNNSKRFGQVIGVITIAVICSFILMLAQQGQAEVAAYLAISSFGSMALISLIAKFIPAVGACRSSANKATAKEHAKGFNANRRRNQGNNNNRNNARRYRKTRHKP